ncbi:MAG: putative adenylate/guanylate cyclase [Alphaproteobacteria bacterium]|nr:putative adenylate/guanylate cyclase [Alphaproteobacteria bacterium]
MADIPAKPQIHAVAVATPSALAQIDNGRRFTIPIGAVLSLSFVALTAVAGLAVVLALLGSLRTTTSLLRERVELLVETVERGLQDQLGPVRIQGQFLADAIIDGELDPENQDKLASWLRASMAGLPQLAGVVFVSRDLKGVRVERLPTDVIVVNAIEVSGSSRLGASMNELRYETSAYWGDLAWNPQFKQPLLNLRVPVWRGGSFVGGIGTAVSMGDLSSIVGRLSPQGGSSFVLYDRDFVLAHPRLTDPKNLLLLPGQVLPRLEQVGDRALTGMWTVEKEKTERFFGADSENIHIAQVDGKDYVYVYHEVASFSDKPLVVGAYFPAEQLYQQTEALRNGAIAAAAALIVALLLGILLGRAISRPMVRLETAADEIREFKFESPPLPRSRFEEIDHANAAVNASRAALHWFSTFVPRKLVTRLLAEGETTLQSKRRDVTVMFTDIVGFTMEAEDLPEAETAAFLNEHFALLAHCIEEEGGVIDKFIGDAIMATWGAIKRIPDHADCAVAASVAIARALHEDNLERIAQGRKPVRVRIGLHSGTVVVGNIGAPGRINYTVVGDTVNTAQRMEQLAKQYMDESEEIVVLASGDTIEALTSTDGLADVLSTPAETHDLRGRVETIKVHKLKMPKFD